MNLEEVYRILQGDELLISPAERDMVVGCFNFLSEYSKDKVIYGINTGFGPMAQYRIADDKLNQLQYNIIRSHATGAGVPLAPVYVKAAMIARIETFLKGKSGVHIEAIELLANFINQSIFPYIPEHGSVGASGDLVQLSHLALTLIGEGEVYYQNELLPAKTVFDRLGLTPLKMHIREGLAIANGTAVMTGIGMVNAFYARRLVDLSVLASVMMNEIAFSYDDFMAEELNLLKPHPGQQQIAQKMRELAKDSQRLQKREEKLYKKHEEEVFKHKVQPYYSLRCVPQILGPVLDTLLNTEAVLEAELNSVDDNPIVDPESRFVYHGGNFHGDYVSFEMDKLKIAITKLTILTERQLNYLYNENVNGILPPFLNKGVLGLNYGLQAAQFTATSTTAECQTLSNPMYIHSIPNNNDNQDIVSMGTNSALITKTVIENAFQVMAIHFVSLAQAIDCLEIASLLSSRSHAMYLKIREIMPVIVEDASCYKEFTQVKELLKNQTIYK